ncbi:hypothetical protein GGR53DRAFT_473750 [Hypoxylon sp. FL1150]|nr:hypothetical protein GGR53DRAFT_473750 [Hypoxylon sp. FL1150]
MNNGSGSTTGVMPQRCEFLAALDNFKATAGLTNTEKTDFQMTSLEELKNCIQTIQRDQEKKKGLMYMKRLDPFLHSMEQYGKVIDVFVNSSDLLGFIWGPLKFILIVAKTFSDALNSVLDAYQDIGEQIPLLEGYQQFLVSNTHMKTVLSMIFQDILEFHREAIKHFKQRLWKQLFQATWRGFTDKINYLKKNLERHRHLIESHATIVIFEEVQLTRESARRSLEQHLEIEHDRRRQRVMEWLSPFSVEDLQDQHRTIRSVCGDTGRWLLNDPRFQKWYNPVQCQTPSLWIYGKPGAGKTILASVIVDEVRGIDQASIAFFYCKYGDPLRNTFMSVAKSLLAQLLVQNSHLLQLLYEKSSMSGEIVLTSKTIAKELLRIALNSCAKTYIILDGLDECDQGNRKEITLWFRSLVDGIPSNEMGAIRCVFVSQDDGSSRKDLGPVPSIEITRSDNKVDVAAFAKFWHRRIEDKFGTIENKNIANLIQAKAQGMFLFAKLLAEYLYGQSSQERLREELEPSKLPVKLDDAYSRILQRIREKRPSNAIEDIWKILGWIVCAPRPLRWREIQAAVCLDLDNQDVNDNRRLRGSPKDLFEALVEVQANDTVELIHNSAREYLIRSDIVAPGRTHLTMALTSVGFLAFPELEVARKKEESEADILEGRLAFLDYASACWVIHLHESLPRKSNALENLVLLIETLEVFIERHWSSNARSITISKTTHKSLEALNKSEAYDRIAQAVGWSNKQLSRSGREPSEDHALDLFHVILQLRTILEEFHRKLAQHEKTKLQQYYGTKWFKCPRVNCFFYHEGFTTIGERNDHVAKHERPFMCIVSGCHVTTFGCVTENALKTHLFDFHGIDFLDDTEFSEPEKQSSSMSRSEGTYKCHICSKKFTRQFNLRSHFRTHSDEKPFTCSVCDAQFTRRSDCVRHERGHGEKKFICSGALEDGSSWGCGAAFGRADKRAAHLRSKIGQKCIRPLLIQEQHNNRDPADALLTGDGLPTFGEFLRLCGLNKPTVEETSKKPGEKN